MPAMSNPNRTNHAATGAPKSTDVLGHDSRRARRDGHSPYAARAARFLSRPFRNPLRALLAALAAVLLTATAACSADGGTADSGNGGDGDRLKVVATFTVIADIARNVAGEHADVESLTRPGAEIHDYEPTPGDVARASDADLMLDNGLGLERWFERFTADAGVPHVTVSDGVEPIDIASDAYAGQPNPHAWMSPKAAKTYVDNIAAAFSEHDPANAEAYRANAEAYKGQLDDLQNELVDGLKDLPDNHRTLVTCEGAFSYLTRDANLREGYIWPVNAEGEATPGQMRDVIAFVKDNDVPAVFCESTVPDGGKRQIMEATGARDGGTLYVDSLTDADGPVPTYLDLIRHDVRTIVNGLK